MSFYILFYIYVENKTKEKYIISFTDLSSKNIKKLRKFENK